MKDRKELAREIESLTEGGYTFDTFTTAAGTDNISLRLYCVETVKIYLQRRNRYKIKTILSYEIQEPVHHR